MDKHEELQRIVNEILDEAYARDKTVLTAKDLVPRLRLRDDLPFPIG